MIRRRVANARPFFFGLTAREVTGTLHDIAMKRKSKARKRQKSTLESAGVSTTLRLPLSSDHAESLSGLPAGFAELTLSYYEQITSAIRRNAHHDHRRALLIDFLRRAFGIEIDEVELELKVKAAEARGRIDAFYKFVIFELKVDINKERADALRELKKYFESRRNPADYVAAVTDGLNFEVYDYDQSSKQPTLLRPFQIDPEKPESAYLQLDELLAAGTKVFPTSDDIVGRFGLTSTTFVRANKQLHEAFSAVEHDSSVAVKFREWNALLSKVYGSAIGDVSLFLRHTYLTILSRAIVKMALFPRRRHEETVYRDLLTGQFFRDQSILNLAEPDFFSWALDTASEAQFSEVFRGIFRRLEEFDWSRLDEDLLKMLYQELVDPTDRSALGEYYTPDWLAEMMLDDVGYSGGSLLDPSCGSGTFLFCAVRKLRKLGMSGKKLIEFATHSIIGLDVHPVAVLLAKANILLALAPELIEHRDFDIQLSVYMSDTLLTEEKKSKHYLGVPDGMGREFAIPLKSVELNRDLDQIIDQMSIYAQRAVGSEKMFSAAQKGFQAKIRDLSMEEANLWLLNFDLMVKLVADRRDTVWAFILKNAFRPAYLRRTKVDLIIGNPPWLSYRDIAEKAYKSRIRDLTFGYGLLTPSERHLFTIMDTSTLFYVHCETEFLKPRGKISFVMPKATIVPSKQHALFQTRGFSRIHDLSKVTVLGNINQHFFNIKSCVVTSATHLYKDFIPAVEWSGQLPRKNMSLAAASRFLERKNVRHAIIRTGHSRSPYFARAFQGATVSPHCLWYVQPDDSGPLNVNRPLLRTQDSAYRLCKEPHWKIRMRGVVEKELLFATALSDDLLPFFVRNLELLVLPVVIDNSHFSMMESDELLGAGFEAGSEWVRKAEAIYAKRSKDKLMSAQQRINFQKLLTAQDPRAEHIVLYNKSGTNICAAYLNIKQSIHIGELEAAAFVAERVTYRIYTQTEEEAAYLVGVLNSAVVNDAIKPYQTVGVFHGKRDITRRPFEVCPIEVYDEDNSLHREIARLSLSACRTMAKWGPKLEGTLAQVRAESRRIVRKEIAQINTLMQRMFKLAKSESIVEDTIDQNPLFGMSTD